MDKNKNVLHSYETAFLLAGMHGLVRLLAIISTFFFWFFVSGLILAFLRLNLVSLDQLLLLNQALGIFGLSPILLTVLSWRIIEKIYAYYLTRYAKKHVKNK